ncbi:syntaxin-11a [Erpetoichthys calabaricus]|uniref:Syntaxin 11a n=1 Tax=Erpetoichthys calabaricus TaxID=27687 RepID=A0A8C4RJ35_ERPCA|nr:syntaxin-11a [Erpetoichthys calabaricus]XP_028647096.1 syntaxin-11a [Erpetoichthys calabaricus]XP_051781253.1 syntaxin-11a [Erpetoichthys calabaricus]XP_051781254.1 syntaxin-11a [Erpetoichthys calabaricus]
MKDRLGDLQNFSDNSTDKLTNDETDNEELVQEAILFDEDHIMDVLFKEVHSLRRENELLKMEVKRLGKQNTRFLTSMRRISSIKRDSNSIARDIKTRGEGIYKRLQKMEASSKEIEEKYGVNSALARIVRAQLVSLTNGFRDAMFEYNEAEMSQRENCKIRIQRQLEIMGKDVSGDQLEDMIEKGKWDVFSENLLTDGKAARSALNEIENRHKELLDLESRIRDVHDLFFQMALLVEEQGSMLNNIEMNVQRTEDYLGEATTHIKKAVEYKKKNPCRQLFCCCFPCCR